MNIYKGKAEVFQKYGDWKNLFLYQLRFWKNSNFVEFIIIKKGRTLYLQLHENYCTFIA